MKSFLISLADTVPATTRRAARIAHRGIVNTGRRRTACWGLSVLALALGTASGAKAVILDYNTTFVNGPDVGTPSNFTAGGFTLGNTLGTVATPVNSTSPSGGYTITTADGGGSASAGNNLGTAAKAGALSTATSSYYTFTLTPTAGYTLTLTDIDFGVRSTSTGPTGYALYSSADNYGSAIYTGTLANNSTYVFKDNTSFSLTSTAALTLRLYVYGGTATAQSTETNRLDDIIVQASAAVTTGGTAPTAYQYFDLNSTAAGSGVANNSTNTFSGTHFNAMADGTGATAAFTNDGTATATFSAGTDSTGKTYTVNIDTAVNTNGITFNDANVTLAHAAGGSLTLSGTGAVNVATGSTATINEAIGVASGVNLTKTGLGTLVLGSTTSSLTGTVYINSGTLSIGSDANLGGASTVSLAGGNLQATASLALAASRTLAGTGGLDVGAGNTLTVNGPVNAGTVTLVSPGTVVLTNTSVALSGVTFNAAGTLDLPTAGVSPSVGTVTFAAPGALTSTGGNTVAITGLTAPTLTSGVATVSPALTYAGATSITTNVGAGGELDVTGSISTPGLTTKGGNLFLAKQGAGTLDLYGNNAGLFRVELGSANATTAPTAGTLSINNNLSLGANQFYFNAGTLNATTDLTGGNAISVGVSIGALSNAPAVFNGSNVEFAGPSDFYESTAATPLSNALTVNNTTILSGTLTSGTRTATLPVLINGTGTLRLTAGNTFSDPVTLSGGVTLDAAATGGAQALGGTTQITVNTGATLRLSTPNQVNTAAPINLNAGTVRLAGGANHGSGATLSGGAVSGTSTVGLGALTLSGNSTLNYTDLATTAVFTSFDPTNAGAGTFTLNVTGTNFGTATDSADGNNNRLIFNEDITNVNGVSYLGDITFNGTAGATETPLDNGFYEITPAVVPEPTTVFGGLLIAGALVWNQRRLRHALTKRVMV